MRKRRREREELEAGMMTAPPESRRITPMDIQQMEFRNSLRGYNEREVDEFLDAVTEELARSQSENIRLRAEMENLQRETKAAQAEAEATLRRAREEASRMLDDAEAQARSVAPDIGEAAGMEEEGAPSVGSFLKKSSMVQAIRPFLGREREFLQSMARLIQEHADSVRDEVRQIRETPPGQPEDGEASLEGGAGSEPGALPGSDSTPEGPRLVPPPTDIQGSGKSKRRRAEPGAGPAPVPDKADRRNSGGGDGRRAKGRQASVPAPGRTDAEDAMWPGTRPENDPVDVFRPRRRVARPPVGRLEDDAAPEQRFEERRSGTDLPVTQPFEPFRFDERSLSADQPLQRREGEDEDERSLRELFWGEE